MSVPSPISPTLPAQSSDIPSQVRQRLDALAVGAEPTAAAAAAVALRQWGARRAADDNTARVDAWWLEQIRNDAVLQPQLTDLLPRRSGGAGGRGAASTPPLVWRSPAVWVPLMAFGLVMLVPLVLRPRPGMPAGGAEPVVPGTAATYELTTGDGTQGLVAVNVRRTSEIERAVGPPGTYVQQITYLGWPDRSTPTRAWHYVQPAPLSDGVMTFGGPPFLWPDGVELLGPKGYMADSAGRIWARLPLQVGPDRSAAFAATLPDGGSFAYQASWSDDEMVEVPAGRFEARRVVESYATDGGLASSVSWYAPVVGLVQREVYGADAVREQQWRLLNATGLSQGEMTPEMAEHVDGLRARLQPAAQPASGDIDAWAWPPAAAVEAAGGPTSPLVMNDLAALAGAATLCEGVVAIPTLAGLVVGLGLTDGNLRWVFGGPGPIDNTPTCMGDRLVFTSGGRRLYAVDARSGLFLWAADLPGLARSAPLSASGSALIGTESGQLAAFQAATGQALWEKGLSRQPFGAGTAGDRLLFVGDADGKLWAIDPTDGSLRWRAELDGPITVAPTVVDEQVYIATDDGVVHAHDAKTGERLSGDWPVRDPSPDPSRPWSPIVLDDVVLVQRQNGDLVFIDRQTGRRLSSIGVFDQVPGGIKAAVTGAPTLAPTGEMVIPVASGAPYVVTVDPASRQVRRFVSLVPGGDRGGTLAGSVHSPLLADGWQVVVVKSFGVDARRWLEDQP